MENCGASRSFGYIYIYIYIYIYNSPVWTSSLFSQKSKLNNEMKRHIGGVWYMHLKTENCYLKTCMKIRVGEKICGNTYNIV